MDSRTRLAVGGMATVAASVAVICTVALTNSAALAHADAAAIPAAKVVVPAAPIPSATAEAAPTSTPEPAVEPETAPAAEVVPAPAPEAMAPSTGTSSGEMTAVPESGTVADDEAIAEADRSGSWEKVRQWAARWGWSAEQVDAWIAELERARDRRGGHGGTGDKSHRPGEPGARWHEDDTDDRPRWTGHREERPAGAGANVGGRPLWPGDDAKKDRSLVSPDSRDR